MLKKKGDARFTLIAANCELVGDVCFSDQLLVNGVVKGKIHARAGSDATLTIGEQGRVWGEIQAPSVIVNGKVYGDIRAAKHIELAVRAEVKGNIYYDLIEMVQGSRVEGQLTYQQGGKERLVDARSPKAAKKTEEDKSVAAVAAVTGQSSRL